MIIDVHTHFWHDGELGEKVFKDIERAKGISARFKMTSELHLNETSVCDKTVVFGLKAKQSGFFISNDTVKAQVDKAPERLIFFTSIDPSEPDFMGELERTHMDMGAKGIKLGPVYQGVHPLDARFKMIYKYAQKNGLPLIIHSAATFASGVPLDYANPLHIAQVASEFPELVIILAHLGHPWIGETVAAIRKEPNLYADISALYYRGWQYYNALMTVTEYGASKKVLFGSDFPFTSPKNSIDALMNANHPVENTGLPKIPKKVLEDILYNEAMEKIILKDG